MPSATGSQRETRHPSTNASTPSDRCAPARAQGVLFTPLAWSPAACRPLGCSSSHGPGDTQLWLFRPEGSSPRLGGASRRVRPELLTLDRIALASLNSVHDCPPCGGDGGIIAQLGKCRITFPEIFLRALNLLGRFLDCVPDGVGRRCKSHRCHPGRKRVSAEEPGPMGLRVPLSRDGSRLSASLRPG